MPCGYVFFDNFPSSGTINGIGIKDSIIAGVYPQIIHLPAKLIRQPLVIIIQKRHKGTACCHDSGIAGTIGPL
jgi:hypothetical protein